jgi:hypothetical protein
MTMESVADTVHKRGNTDARPSGREAAPHKIVILGRGPCRPARREASPKTLGSGLVARHPIECIQVSLVGSAGDAGTSEDRISRITEKVTAELAEWQRRRLDRVYPVIFIDAIVVKVRDGQVTNKPFYVFIGVTTAGERDILGIWAGDGGEGAKLWLNVLTGIKSRGVEDVLIAVCDGLKGLPDAITTGWEYTQIQACVIILAPDRQHRVLHQGCRNLHRPDPGRCPLVR